MPRITLNAHLLSAQANYRSAGIHGYILHLLAHLPIIAPDWDFEVCVGAGKPPRFENLHSHRSTFAARSPLHRIIWEQALQRRTLSQLKPDLQHGLAFILPLGSRVPGVVTVHDLSFLRFPEALSPARRLYLSAFTRRSCQAAKRIIAVSQSTARDVETLLGISPEKIRVVLHGVDDRFTPYSPAEIAAFRALKKLPERFILHLGTLEPRKNLPMLIRAYASLPPDLRKAVHLVLAGGKGWGYDPIFRTIAEHQLEEHVHWVGYVSDEELPLWYNAAEILAYPSIFEGWGMPITEALACGTPTLVSDQSSMPEAAGQSGLILPFDDPSAWREGLHMALMDMTWQATSRQAGLEHARAFRWQKTAKDTLSVYREVMNEAE